MSSETTIQQGLVKCANTTVGDTAYQMFCVSSQNITGSCSTLPPNNHVDCTNVTSNAFLQQYLKSTGNACGINCYTLSDNQTLTNQSTPAPSSSNTTTTNHTSYAIHTRHIDPIVLFASVFVLVYVFLYNKTSL